MSSSPANEAPRMILSPSPRTSLAVLLAAGALAMLGLGLAVQAWSRAPLSLAPLSPIVATGAPAPASDAPPGDWAALFGTPRPAEPEPEPTLEPEREPMDEPAWFDPDSIILRGLVAEADGGMAFVEIDSEILVVREGDMVLEDILIGAVLPRGLEVEFDGEVYLIEFNEDAASPPMRPMNPDLPPPGSLDAPSFSGYSGGQAPPAAPPNRFGISR